MAVAFADDDAIESARSRQKRPDVARGVDAAMDVSFGVNRL